MASPAEQARAAGYTDAEIANHLAQRSSGFDIDGARKAGYTDSQLVAFLSEQDPTTGAPRSTGTPATESPEVLRERRIARSRQLSDSERTISEYENDPSRSGNTVVEGFGKAFVDTGRGVNQLFSTGDRAKRITSEIDDSRALDAPLMRTTGGTIGNVFGGVAQTIPSMFVPGAATLTGSALTGAAYGAAQPVATGESRAANTTIGAAAGVAGPLVARTTGAVVRGAKALAEPFTIAGRERIAGRTLGRFGITPADTAGLTSAPTATGARTTMAEQIARPEGAAAAARLQDSIRAQNPDVAASMAAREGENNAARVGVLERNAAPRDAAAQARSTQAGALYEQAKKGTFQPDIKFAQLMERPSIKAAMGKAATNMADQGTTMQPNSIAALHEAKLAMDDQISALMAGKPTASTVNEAQSIKMAQAELLKFIEQASPNYAKARQLYATMSEPVNQADIAGELLRKGSANTTDLSGTPRLMPNALTGAMRDEGRLIKDATGRALGDDLSKVMTKQQLDDINAVVGEVDRAAAVARAGNGPGSATAQRLAGTNIIEQMSKGSGLPDSTAGSTIVQEWLSRPLNFLYKSAAEPKIQMTLGEIILNPALANKAMAAASAPQRAQLARVLSNKYLQQSARAALPASAEANRR